MPENIWEGDLRSKLCHLDAAVTLGLAVAIFPGRVKELRGADDNLRETDAGGGGDGMDDGMDPGIETEDEASVVAIEDEIASREQDLSGS